MRILLVDDDRTLIDILTRTLAECNYAIDVATDGEQGWVYGSTYTYDLMILDWSLPKLDGISLCQRFRSHGYSTPIILLTSRQGSQNKIKGLDAGADDYICKPFDIEELTARIRALLRRLDCSFLPLLSWGELKLDPSSCQVTYQKSLLALGNKEYALLELFLRHRQEVLTIEDIIESLWSSMEYPAVATVRSHIRRLRHKLKLAGLPEDIIATVRGQGYCLKPLFAEKPSLPEPQLDKISKHQAVLKSIWYKHQPKRQQQLATLEGAIAKLKTNNLTLSDRLSAIVAAHSLAGNLGQFGLDLASQLAKELEQSLQNNPLPQQWQELSSKLNTLSQEIAGDRDIENQIDRTVEQNAPFLLIVSDFPQLSSQLVREAKNNGIRSQTLPAAESATSWLESVKNSPEKLPNVVLITISFNSSELLPQKLALIAEFNLLVPSIPVIVVADRDRFQDRLQVARHGSRFFLTQPVNPRQTINFCQQVIQNSAFNKKIMLVDDDLEILQLIPQLLKPWGFQITTLEDPRQFWDVLQAVTPDLLILDIDMPHLSGIELCKVLRTHNYWRKLPVLFLSVHNDGTISNQAFISGANDFVQKPATAKQLAHRIINQLNFGK